MSAGQRVSRGRFVVLDGVDGCGKSTQARRLHAAWSREAPAERAPLHLREPGSTGVGEGIRALLLDRERTIGAPAEALLFCAARRQTLDELVRPALAAGRDVVCERFHASTFAYQSVAGSVPEAQLLELLRTWAGDPAPDLTLILDLAPTDALRRRSSAPDAADDDRIEAKGLAFQERVADGYRRYAALDPNTRRIAADGDEDAVHALVLEAVGGLAPRAAEGAQR